MGVVPYKQRGWKYSNSIVLFFDLSKRAKDGCQPLYVERSDVQQLCCSEFDLLFGKILKNRIKPNTSRVAPAC